MRRQGRSKTLECGEDPLRVVGAGLNEQVEGVSGPGVPVHRHSPPANDYEGHPSLDKLSKEVFIVERSLEFTHSVVRKSRPAGLLGSLVSAVGDPLLATPVRSRKSAP